uniref:Uncharacterized protein n=1 Tax=Leersia perrieri TaxID=77586 RepID=A0A0D9V7T7_9ORYZ
MEVLRCRMSQGGRVFGCPLPVVIGLPVDEARRRIRQCRPDVYIEVLSENQMRTMAYCSNRVRLIVNRFNKVVKNAHIG